MSQRLAKILLHALCFFSGAAALGYQLVWSKMFSTGLGHEMPAVLAIIAAFMGGMALGAVAMDRFIPRSAQAGFWLAGLELTIGVWAGASSLLIPQANEAALKLIGLAPDAVRHWAVAFAIPAIVLLPATFAIGATFPAMEKFLSALAPENQSIGSVYAANTLGAVAGTLLAPFVLMPALGLSKSCWILAGLNGAVSVAAFGLARTRRAVSLSPQPGEEGLTRGPLSSYRIALTLFIAGLLGLGCETAGVRVLTQVLEGTIYTYAVVLAVFLFGTAAGAASYHRWWRKVEPARLLTILLSLTATGCFVSVGILARSPGLYRLLRDWNTSATWTPLAELITALAVFALPTFFMGALFSLLVQLGRSGRGRVGGFVALNTLGAALAPVAAAWLIPTLGCQWMLVILGAGYLLLFWKRPPIWAGLCAVAGLFLALNSNLRLVDVPAGGRITEYREGVMASVAVLADEAGQRTLRVDNRFQMGGTAAADAEYRQAHLPLLLHPAPQRALFLGLGTGISFGAASLYPNLQADGVELVPEVVKVMPAFAPKNFNPHQQPQLRLHVADARRFVRAMEERYDVIIGDLFHPYRDGAGALYTREHFAAFRQRLATNGLFCQWLPLHQLDQPTLQTIIRTFQSEFPFAEAWLLRFNVDIPVVALIGRPGGQPWRSNLVESRLGEPRLNDALKRLALADSLRLQGHFLAGPEDLRAFAGNAPLNTDDNQFVTFLAPRAAYQRATKPYASLLALLDASTIQQDKSGPAAAPGEEEFTTRLSRYLAARNAYLRGLVHDAEQRREAAVTAYVESARLSPEFTSGYAQCLAQASAIAKSDPAGARRLLERLIEAQPERPVARQMLEKLFPR